MFSTTAAVSGKPCSADGDFDQNAGAPVLLASQLVQAKGFECRAQLDRQDRDFGYGVLVKARIGRALHERDGAHHIARNQQRRGHGGMRLTFSQPGITSGVEVVEEEGATLVNRFDRDGWVPGALAHATKGLSMFAVGFGSNQFTVGGVTPKIGTAGMEEGASTGRKTTG